ncbi:hypothetical protein U8V72_11680 [Priestia filamentosa]|uniref:hypothetical protein n=1 Tax=Priestia filamentosa TaxID=1402861 RepID=UPI0005892928
MIKKHLKPILVVGALSFLVIGCSKEEEKTPQSDSSKKEEVVSSKDVFQAESYYKLKDDDVLVEVKGEKLTVSDLKESAFKQLMLTEVNQFIENQLLLQKYPVSDSEIQKLADQYGKDAKVDRAQLKLQLAHEKAINEGFTVTDKDLKAIYDANFKDSGKTFEEMKEDLKKQAPYFFGESQLSKNIASLRTDENVKFRDDKLKEEVNNLFVQPTQEEQTQTPSAQ